MAPIALGTVLHDLRRSLLRHDETGLSDGELLECFVTRRDEAAFEALLRRHGPMVLGVCRRVLRNEADAEDAFQATFLVLVRKAASIRPRGMVGNWLYGVAHSTALNARATSTRRLVKEREAAARPEPEAPTVTREELHALLDQELKGLPDTYRAAITLCDLEGKTIKEAAGQLGWPQGTVGTRLARGRALLARRLARHGLPLSGAALTSAMAHGPASACVPTSLVVSTVQAATLVAAGQTVAAASVSTEVASLTEGVLKAMLTTKLKALTAVLLAVTLLGGGALLAYGSLRARQEDARHDGKSEPASAKEEKPKSDKEALQGTWVEVSRGEDGAKLPEDKRWKLVFDGDKVTVIGFGTKDGAKEREGTFTIDADKKPKEIDLTLGSLGLNGIYERKGTTLKTLWRENDRPGLPATFDAKKGVLIVFEKEKK